MSEKTAPRVRVWDLPTRVFHWLLVTLIFCAWASFEFSDKIGDTSLLWHRLNGYAILVLIIWRLLWGLVGSPASRFSNFLVWPWNAMRYGVDLARGRERHFLGHNPLGSYMIIALLGLVAFQGTLGLFATEHNYVTWGPLSSIVDEESSKTLTKRHVWLFDNVLLIFIGAHVAANLLYRLIKKDQLIEAMVIGSKPPADYADQMVAIGTTDTASSGDREVTTAAATTASSGTIVRALVCLVLAVAIFVGAVLSLGGKFLS